MKKTLSPCCARAIAKVRMAERDLAGVARRASRYPESPRWAEMIKNARASVAECKRCLADHEAEHAGELEVAAR